MCREFHRAMDREGPSHTTLLRYATGHVKRRNVVTEQYVREAIHKITRELSETQRKQLKKVLRESEEKFRGLVEHNNDMVWEVNQEGAYTYVSPNVQEILGYSPEQLIGKTPFEFMPEKEAERVGQIFGQAVQKRAVFTSLQHKALCKDGKVILLECSGRPITNDAGNFRGYRGIDRDITERSEE